jgi:hypothetical protein
MNDIAARGTGQAAAVPAGHWAVAADQRARPLWLRLAGPILSIAIILAVINAFGARDLVELWQSLPRSPLFWLTLAALWAAVPVADFVIYRALWGLPIVGLAALFRKAATNELVFGYTGELQFYVWARRNADIPGSPFGAVRDVSVLSALVGNVVTIALLIMALPVLGRTPINPWGPNLIWSAIALIGSSIAVILFRHRLFALSRAQFWGIAAVHLVRAILVIVLFGTLWYLVQPTVTLGWWVILAAARQFVTRLPFLPNKDLVFAGLTAQLLSGDTNLTDTVVLVATLFAAGQVLIGGALAVIDLVREALLRRSAS